MVHPYWPLFDLQVRTPRITLQYIDDELAERLARLAAKGVHDPEVMPFSVPWTDAPPGELERNTLQFYWRCRAELSVDAWSLTFAVLVDGEPVGSTALTAKHFPTLRCFETGSWLGREFQGRGLGKELRAATLHLGFEGFGAELAETGAFDDNAASLGVTRSLGYAENGTRRERRRGARATILGFTMTAEHWRTIRRHDIELDGVDAVLPLLGLDDDIGPTPVSVPDAT